MKTVLIATASGLELGGIQTFLRNVIGSLEPGKYRILWFAPREEHQDAELKAWFESHGVEFIFYEHASDSRGLNLGTVRECMRIRRGLGDVMRAHRVDVLHVNTENPMYEAIAQRVGKKRKIPVRIAHSHNSTAVGGAEGLKGLVYSLCRGAIRRSATCVAACSAQAAEFLAGHGAAFAYIRNRIDAEKFRFDAAKRERTRHKHNLTEDNFVVGHVGRFTEQKNQLFLIDVFDRVHRANDSARLLLVGGGTMEHQLRQAAEERNLTDAVIFAGVSDQVDAYLSAMDVFVFPSLFEGLGISIIEAQTAGLRCVVSDAVPQEAFVTELVEPLPLSAGAERWAEAVLRHADGYERKDMTSVVAAAGYDVRDLASDIEKLWEGNHAQRN